MASYKPMPLDYKVRFYQQRQVFGSFTSQDDAKEYAVLLSKRWGKSTAEVLDKDNKVIFHVAQS